MISPRRPARIRLAAGLVVLALITVVVASSVTSPALPRYFAPDRAADGVASPQFAASPVPPSPTVVSPLLDPRWANLSSAGAISPPSGPATMVYDAQDGYVVWFGLAASGIAGGATWTYASGAWVNRTATAGGGPIGATWGTAAYDVGDGYVVWYGGTNPPSSSATWKFTAGKWTNLTSGLATSPSPARELASAAYDQGIGAVVLFGGWDGTAYLNDTWTFSHGTWSAVTSNASPSPRVSTGLAYDGADGYLVLAGGGNAAGSDSDTWSFSGTNWTPIVRSGGPVGIGGPEGLTPSPGGGVVGFGGTGCDLPLQGPCNLTYEFYTGAWHQLPPGGSPSVRTGMQLAYDANDATVLGWGGADGAGFHDDTWGLGGALHLLAVAEPAVVAPDGASNFVATASGGYGNDSFTWTGTPPDCALVNASVMPCESEIPGNYTLVSHLVDAAGNASTALAGFEVLFQLSSELSITPQTIDVGQTSTLRVTVAGGDHVVNYSWVGLPAACSRPNGSVVNCTPTNPGYFSVEVTVTDSLGDVTTSPDLALSVNALPSVGAWSDGSLGTTPFAVQFYSSVFGGAAPYTFLWAFGDATNGSGPAPTHTYTTSGVFAVQVTVTDALGAAVSSANLTVDVENPLLVQPQASASYPASGEAVTFSAVISGGGAPYTYAWTFGDGATSTASRAQHAFSATGAHTVVLVVTDAHGVTAIATLEVDVQGAAGSESGANSFLASPWVAGLIGAAIGIAITSFAIRPPAAERPPSAERDETSPRDESAPEAATRPPTRDL